MRSMTGFGSGEATTEQWRVVVELTGVNRRQLDISVNLPGSLAELDPEVRRRITGEISRGRVNARITFVNHADQANALFIDRSLARQYLAYARELAETEGVECTLSTSDLFRAPGIFTIEETEVPVEAVEGLVLDALGVALEKLAGMQREEGDLLKRDMEMRIGRIADEMEGVRGYAREVVDRYRESLFGRLTDCGLDINLEDERVLREIALYAERSDITEELTRIESHVAQFRKYFSSDEPVGRPLDFLCQELNRELNTIGSKANHASIAQSVVNAKTELEKVREQVQNIQ